MRMGPPDYAPPPYVPPTGPWYPAPAPAYAPNPTGYYGWVPPTDAFPHAPAGMFRLKKPPSCFISSLIIFHYYDAPGTQIDPFSFC